MDAFARDLVQSPDDYFSRYARRIRLSASVRHSITADIIHIYYRASHLLTGREGVHCEGS